jgi:hypothetical protein
VRKFLVALLGLIAAVPAFAQTPALDPRTWRGRQVGAPTEVLTLGSAHLGQMEPLVTPEMLVPLLDKLAAFRPEIMR